VEVGNWPRYTILRGQLVWDKAKGIVGKIGYGKFLKRRKGQVLEGRTGNILRGALEDERKYWM